MPDPSHAIALAQSLLRENKPQAALLHLQKLVAKHPGDAGIHPLIASVHLTLGRPDQALFFAQRAADLDPKTVRNRTNLGIVLMACAKTAQAIPILRSVLDEDPDDQEALLSLANSLLAQRQAGEALSLCQRGLAAGWHTQLAVSCAGALLALADYEDAVAFLKDATARDREPRLALSLAQALVGLSTTSPQDQAEAHRAVGRLFEKAAPPAQAAYTPVEDPERRLRIGLISPDLRQHSVAYFIEPFLESFDRAALDVVCYSTNPTFDAVSRRLKSHATLWRDAAALSDEALASQCAKDRIDIAIDLAGHTHGHRLSAFASRLAPIQITYLGYPDTTGLTQMDYRIVDSLTDPRDAYNGCTETLIRLDPSFLCWRPPPEAPAIQPRTSGPIAFGSFNDTRKNNPALMAMWGRILAACPGSTLVLKSMNFCDPAIVQRTNTMMEAAGIALDRVRLLQPSGTVADHLAQYCQLDIALDPSPYNGTTTTCEALWMGVPVVTLAGNRHAGRVGVSLLTNIGVPELIAGDQADYVRIATILAQDPARVAAYRSTLRPRMISSPLCDGPGFSRRFEQALRAAWRDYCLK